MKYRSGVRCPYLAMSSLTSVSEKNCGPSGVISPLFSPVLLTWIPLSIESSSMMRSVAPGRVLTQVCVAVLFGLASVSSIVSMNESPM